MSIVDASAHRVRVQVELAVYPCGAHCMLLSRRWCLFVGFYLVASSDSLFRSCTHYKYAQHSGAHGERDLWAVDKINTPSSRKTVHSSSLLFIFFISSPVLDRIPRPIHLLAAMVCARCTSISREVFYSNTKKKKLMRHLSANACAEREK